ncbi:MAG: alpha/beta hydrolase [Bacteroidia bacterium]|nr:alpha/beta hydrolase [Bacteroidia bacterium]
MKTMKIIFAAIAFLTCTAAGAQGFRTRSNPDGPFKISIGECTHGRIEVSPAIGPEGTEFPKNTVLKVKAVPDAGYAFECGYYAMNGQFAFYTEYFAQEFEVVVNGNGTIGGSFVEPSILEGYTCKQDIVYAQPGVKPLKYDAFIPDGAKKLPGIVIIHGGGWTMNCEDVMKGLARELVKDGKYVAFSIDYRWNGTADGDATPNTMDQIIEDCYGAILHIQEHAKEYGLDPKRLAVTGDSAGGHLCASVANMIERVGDGGFGKTPGVYEFLPTYVPKGMSMKTVRKNLLAIKAVAPNYGIFSAQVMQRFVRNLPEDGQKAVAPLDNIPDPELRRIPTWLNRGTEDTTVNDESTVEYFEALKAAGQEAYYIKIPGAQHAYYDWKPDSATKATFWKYGAPYAHQMEEFFNTIFYK